AAHRGTHHDGQRRVCPWHRPVRAADGPASVHFPPECRRCVVPWVHRAVETELGYYGRARFGRGGPGSINDERTAAAPPGGRSRYHPAQGAAARGGAEVHLGRGLS